MVASRFEVIGLILPIFRCVQQFNILVLELLKT